jgi:hypothetical protein
VKWLICHGVGVAALLGDKGRFTVEVGDWDGPALRRNDRQRAVVPLPRRGSPGHHGPVLARGAPALKHPEDVGMVFVVETQVPELAGILEDLGVILDRDEAGLAAN